MSSNIETNTNESKNEDNEVYFIVLIPSEEKIDFNNLKLKSDIIPEIIHNKSIPKGNKGNESYLEEIVFNIVKENIDQNIVPYYNKLNILIEALQENNEINNIEKLYEDTIALYEKKKKFSLLISLFLKMYAQNKYLCTKLLDIFYSINEQENTDRDKDMESNLSSFKQIYENTSDIIQSNEYDIIKFYGVIFCYFNYYDKNKFYYNLHN